MRILFGRWQDVLPQLGTYDGIFFDTCAIARWPQPRLRPSTMYNALDLLASCAVMSAGPVAQLCAHSVLSVTRSFGEYYDDLR